MPPINASISHANIVTVLQPADGGRVIYRGIVRRAVGHVRHIGPGMSASEIVVVREAFPSATARGAISVTTVCEDHLTAAEFVPPASVTLRFADGFTGTWPLSQLEINWQGLNPRTIKAASSGTSLEVRTDSGRRVRLDVSAIRAVVDSEYEARMRAAFMALRGPLEDLEKMASQPR